MKEVRSPISSHKRTEGLPTSPGAHSLRNRFATDAAQEPAKVTSGDLKDKRDQSAPSGPPERSDGGLSPAQHHLARHRLLHLGREDR
jgi:hypothetical protein